MPALTTLAGESFSPEIPARLLSIASEIRGAGGRAFLVGGWVRDALLGRNCRDYDVEVYDLTQDELVPILKRYGKTNLVGKAFGVIHLAMKGLSLDFSFPRTESKVGYGHRGFVVHTDERLSFREAALRRDFTINAMGMELPELTLCDPYGGINDLKQGLLRHVGPAFIEDSLRILRGVQFASRFALRLAPETIDLCRTLSLDDLSVERLFEEFKKWLLKPGKPSLGLRAFLDIRLDEYFPEIKPLGVCGEIGWQNLGSLLDNLSQMEGLTEDDRMVVMFAGLLAGNANFAGNAAAAGNVAVSGDQAQTDVTQFISRITNEVKLVRGVPLLLRYAFAVKPEDGIPTDAEIRRLSVALGGLRRLNAFIASESLTDLAERSAFASDFQKRAEELGVFESAPQPFLTGKILMDLGMKPGKQMGDIIKQSFELQLDGEIDGAEQAAIWARALLSKN